MMSLHLRTVAFLALVGWVAASALPEPEEENLNYLTLEELHDQFIGDGSRDPNANTDPDHTRMVLKSVLYHYDHDVDSESSATRDLIRSGDRDFVVMLLDMDKLAVGNCNTKFFCLREFMTEVHLKGSPLLYIYAKDTQQKQIEFCRKNSDFKSLPQSDECASAFEDEQDV